MGTACKYSKGFQVFSGTPQFISTGGNILTNQQLVNSTTETAILTFSMYGNLLNATSMGFRVKMGGEISSTGTGDATLILKYGTTALITLATVGLANEDDIPFVAEFNGHVLTAGSSGKIVGTGTIAVYQAAAVLQFAADTALTGAAVDLTADGALNVTADWDAASADNDIIATWGFTELFN